MIRDITLGQYYPAKSVIHALDPRVKLAAALVYIVMLFLIGSAWGYAFVIVCLALLVKTSKVPPSFMFRGLKPVLFIILFTMVLNIFFTTGGQTLFAFGFIRVTTGGLVTALKMVTRLILLISGTSVLTLTTSPIQLTDGIEYALKPFKRFGVPSHEIAMMMTIALRFIPTLLEETDKIMKAQMARGADFETGSMLKRAKSLIPLLVPLFISAFRRADELAMAMEARCYRGDVNRTRMKQMRLERRDYYAMAVMALFAAAVCAFMVFN